MLNQISRNIPFVYYEHPHDREASAFSIQVLRLALMLLICFSYEIEEIFKCSIALHSCCFLFVLNPALSSTSVTRARRPPNNLLPYSQSERNSDKTRIGLFLKLRYTICSRILGLRHVTVQIIHVSICLLYSSVLRKAGRVTRDLTYYQVDRNPKANHIAVVNNLIR